MQVIETISELLEREKYHLFFVLHGYRDGDENYPLFRDQFSDERLADGWYAVSDDDELIGPRMTMQQIEKAAIEAWGE